MRRQGNSHLSPGSSSTETTTTPPTYNPTVPVPRLELLASDESGNLQQTFKQLVTVVGCLSEQIRNISVDHEEKLRQLEAKHKQQLQNEKSKITRIERFLEDKVQQYDHLLKQEQRAVKEISAKCDSLSQQNKTLESNIRTFSNRRRANSQGNPLPDQAILEDVPPEAKATLSKIIKEVIPHAADNRFGSDSVSGLKQLIQVLVGQLRAEKQQRLATEEQGLAIQNEFGKTIMILEQRLRQAEGSGHGRKSPSRSVSPLHFSERGSYQKPHRFYSPVVKEDPQVSPVGSPAVSSAGDFSSQPPPPPPPPPPSSSSHRVTSQRAEEFINRERERMARNSVTPSRGRKDPVASVDDGAKDSDLGNENHHATKDQSSVKTVTNHKSKTPDRRSRSSVSPSVNGKLDALSKQFASGNTIDTLAELDAVMQSLHEVVLN
eukprot:TRINITY_DN1266_c6_g1_i1.p1 TRINITY_DN1266_c6_g1~~TRINITY_DN1266_c6_g1_i1.p1  ORF type:complete len:454 (+),score=88.49 TRINITY_DN1266_c6_g1_i1:63-1364(+)